MTSIVVGPGLGRDDSLFDTLDIVLTRALEDKNMTLVGDADFLWFLSDSPNKHKLIEKVKQLKHRAVLSPNIVEF